MKEVRLIRPLKTGDFMGVEKKVLSVRLDDELIKALKIIAEDENRPLSNLIETILKQYVRSRKPDAAKK